MKIKIRMEKILAAIALVSAMLLCACGDTDSEPTNEPAPSDITSAIMAEIEIPSAVEKDKNTIGAYYDFDIEQAEAISVFICGSGAYPDELAVFKMDSSEAAASVAETAQKRLDSQIELYKDYTPDEMYKLDSAEVTVKGNYVMLFICSDNAKASEIANGLF